MIIKYSEGTVSGVVETSNDKKDKLEKLTLEAFEKQKNDDDLKKEAAANSNNKPFWANERK